MSHFMLRTFPFLPTRHGSPITNKQRAKCMVNVVSIRSIHQHHLGHLVETYITDLLVSFQLRVGLAVHIVKFRPTKLERVGGTLVV